MVSVPHFCRTQRAVEENSGRARASSSGNRSFELQKKNQDNRKSERRLHFVNQRSEHLRCPVLKALDYYHLMSRFILIVRVFDPLFPYLKTVG